MKNTTTFINERKRDAENAAYVRELLNQRFTLPKENREVLSSSFPLFTQKISSNFFSNIFF